MQWKSSNSIKKNVKLIKRIDSMTKKSASNDFKSWEKPKIIHTAVWAKVTILRTSFVRSFVHSFVGWFVQNSHILHTYFDAVDSFHMYWTHWIHKFNFSSSPSQFKSMFFLIFSILFFFLVNCDNERDINSAKTIVNVNLISNSNVNEM